MSWMSGAGSEREMDIAGRLSPFLAGLTSMALFSDEIYGHAWVEVGRVVGNVTLQEADTSGLRWPITNVAVAPVSGTRHRPELDARDVARDRLARGRLGHPPGTRAGNPPPTASTGTSIHRCDRRTGVWPLPSTPAHPPDSTRTCRLPRFRALTGDEWFDRLARAETDAGTYGPNRQPRGVSARAGPVAGGSVGPVAGALLCGSAGPSGKKAG